jgi:hypothetical protein
VTTPLPAGFVSGGLGAISCLGSGYCAAVGSAQLTGVKDTEPIAEDN